MAMLSGHVTVLYKMSFITHSRIIILSKLMSTFHHSRVCLQVADGHSLLLWSVSAKYIEWPAVQMLEVDNKKSKLYEIWLFVDLLDSEHRQHVRSENPATLHEPRLSLAQATFFCTSVTRKLIGVLATIRFRISVFPWEKSEGFAKEVTDEDSWT